MTEQLLQRLRAHSAEEQMLLRGEENAVLSRYPTGDFTLDFNQMLAEGQLLAVRTHTRFIAFPRHKHNYIEIVYMCEGSTTHVVDGNKIVKLQQGEFLFLNQNAYHSIQRAEEGDIAVNFVMRPAFLDVALGMMEKDSPLKSFLATTLTDKRSAPSYLHFRAQGDLPVHNLVENLVWHALSGENAREIEQTTMGLLFLELMRRAGVVKGDNDGYETSIVMRVLRYIEDNPATATLTEIATRTKQSVSGLSKLVSSVTGKTFQQLLQQKRMQRAEYLLENTDIPVTDIITGIGYENTAYFHRLFREKHGVSLRQYRLNYLQVGK